MKTKSNKQSRKSFLKKWSIAGLGLAGGLGLAVKTLGQKADEPVETGGEWRPTTCQGCTSWCAVQVYVVNGRAVKVRGNPSSKVNVGRACVRSHMSLQQVYDPDRVKTPMKRSNPKKGRNEDPKWVPITWDQAADEIADKILELRKNGETHKYLLMRGRYTYMRDLIYDRMTKIIGSPNNISHSAICAEAEKFGPYYTEGLWDYRQYDVEKAKFVLLWGADPIAANRQVSYYSSIWGKVAEQATIAVVDPRLSATAAKADEWMPLKPGTDGALASAIAHTVLTAGFWSREFVGDFKDGKNHFEAGETVKESEFKEIHTSGLIKWWNLELKDKTPEWAAGVTGLPVEQIRRTALAYGKAAPRAISWVGGGPVMQIRGAYTSMACNALNGLVGAVDNEGGTMMANSVKIVSFPDPAPFMDAVAKKGKKQKKLDHRGRKEFPSLKKGKPGKAVVTNRLADGILNSDPYDVKVAIAYMNNFAFSCPQSERWEKALAKIPFLVHLTTNVSELTWFADIVLPCAHHMYEKWGFVKSHANGHRHVPLLQPVIKPVYDVKQDETEIPWLIAEKLAAKGFPNLLEYYKSIRDPETNKAPESEGEFALSALKYATQHLWDPAKHEGGDKFKGWEHFRQVGVWNSKPYEYRKRWEKGFKTKTKKFEFFSETLKSALQLHALKSLTTVNNILKVCNYQARGDLAYVPHYEEPMTVGSEKEFPLVFVDFKSRLNREGRSSNCEWYQEFKNLDPGDEKYQDTARFHPSDGKKLGIKDGDKIRIISTTGSLECHAKLWEGNRPGTVSKAYGQGHWVYGRNSSEEFGVKERGGNNNALLPAEYDRLSGSTAYYGFCRVRVEVI